MPDSVVARVADRLDIQPEQTDQVLRTLAQLIKKQSARDGQVRVPGLGVFQQTTDSLTFEPDASLSEAINHRFAGLAPVPMTQEPEPPEPTPEEVPPKTPPSFFTPPLPVVQDELEDLAPVPPPIEEAPSVEESATVEVVEEEPLKAEAFVVDQPVAQDQAAEEEAVEEKILEQKPVAEDVLEQQVEEEAEKHEAKRPSDLLKEIDFNNPDISEAAAYAKLQEESETTEEDAPSQWAPPGAVWSQENLEELLQEMGEQEPLAEEVDTEASVVDEEAPPTTTTEQDEARPAAVALPDRSADLPPKPHLPKKLHTQEAPRRRSVLPWILLIAAVIVIGSSLYYFFGPPSQTTTSDTPPIVTEQTPSPEATEAALAAADTLENASADTTSEITTPVATLPQETPAEAPSALRIDVARGGYTLVVGSAIQRATAEAQAERFRQRLSGQSLPVDVLVGETTDGVTRYRVVVGQVETSQEAVALKNRHAANLPEGTWPINISLMRSGS